MDSSNKKHGVHKLSHEISRLSSENDQLRKMVGLMQENVELRFVLQEHEDHVKSFSPPPPAEQSQVTDSSKDDASSFVDDNKSLQKPVYNSSLNMGGLGISSHCDRHRSKQVSMKGYETSGSSSLQENESRKSFSPPSPAAKRQADYQQIADSIKDDFKSADDKRSLYKPSKNRSLYIEGHGMSGHIDKPRSKHVSMKGYESSGSSSDSLSDHHGKEQRKLVSSVTKLLGHERGTTGSSHCLQLERRMAHYK
ncbi:uncharacterized protein LOC122935653 [Bufo gargarizans]|uniref:uncharacterized protein LOC122935653 n=1 Tax=Bufo gargarizans TaxID=30331 RepID=UPI001CF5E13E|nr:uncharacterized protein LOC122935653 [Bufo gargarizans]